MSVFIYCTTTAAAQWSTVLDRDYAASGAEDVKAKGDGDVSIAGDDIWTLVDTANWTDGDVVPSTGLDLDWTGATSAALRLRLADAISGLDSAADEVRLTWSMTKTYTTTSIYGRWRAVGDLTLSPVPDAGMTVRGDGLLEIESEAADKVTVTTETMKLWWRMTIDPSGSVTMEKGDTEGGLAYFGRATVRSVTTTAAIGWGDEPLMFMESTGGSGMTWVLVSLKIEHRAGE